ncbi:MAG: outer membrane protein assembly factor BamE [Bryobacteraceae bacterium]
MSPRILLAGALIFASSLVPQHLVAQSRNARDRQFDQLMEEVAQLRRTVAEQDRRILQLEKDVRAMQISSVPGPIPSLTPLWQESSKWNLIKVGMSRAQVVEILGPPTRESSVLDGQTLYYAPDSKSASTPSGTVTLVGDRLTAMMPPAFEK